MSLNTAPLPATDTATAASSAALNAISGNFNDFLSLLTTQLQNQDPSSPMDTSQFTSELAQFAGVQQQVDTNTNLASLLQVAQGQALLQGTSLIGQPVSLNGTTLPLQNGVGTVTFTAPGAEPVQITVQDAAGDTLASQTVTAAQGANRWTWNGLGPSGATEPDGAYTVSVNAVGAGGALTALPFTTGGTVTGVVNTAGTVDLQFGPTTLALADLASVGN
jgi:flagellar basal-body rod modification protein FlgD